MDTAAIAAIAPLVAPLLPVIGNDIISLITGLVHQKAPVAQAANPVPGTGAVRFVDVFTGTMQTLVDLHAKGQIAGPLPDESIVKIIIQAVVTSMKLPGGLLGSPAPASSSSSSVQSIVLTAGQSLSISVA